MDTCVAFSLAMLDSGIGEFLGELVDQGSVYYDPAQASACVEAIRAASCDEMDDPSIGAQCYPLLRGTRGGGEPCTSSWDCESFECDTSAGCPGVCEPLLGLGDACGSMIDNCDIGLDCQEGTCQPEAPLGEAGDPCEIDWDCDNDLYCRPEDSVCAARLGAGEPCTQHASCAGGHYCAPQGMWTCELVQPVSVAGQPCNPGEYLICDLSQELDCAISTADYEPHTCQPVRAQGEPCLAEDPVSGLQLLYPCDPLAALYCDYTTAEPTCQPRKAYGDLCTTDMECATMTCSDSGTCTWASLCEPE